MPDDTIDPDFPCSMSVSRGSHTHDTSTTDPLPSVFSIPLPTHRLASAALRALQVDAELSPLVQRSFSLAAGNKRHPTSKKRFNHSLEATEVPNGLHMNEAAESEETVLITEYKATTNRMLRVAVNGFMESLGLVLGVMEELDVDVLGEGS
jgi:EKC/KEOPS complex subunit PCC1/LAGE3